MHCGRVNAIRLLCSSSSMSGMVTTRRLQQSSSRRAFSSNSTENTGISYGGRDEQSFRDLCEGSSKFIKDVLSPKIDTLNKESLTMLLPFKQDFIGNPLIPCLHGGIAASMLDHTASFCAAAALEDKNLYLVTSDLRIDYLLPAPCEDLYFDATIVHKSKKLIRVDASCWNFDRTKQIAIGRGLFSVCETVESV